MKRISDRKIKTLSTICLVLLFLLFTSVYFYKVERDKVQKVSLLLYLEQVEYKMVLIPLFTGLVSEEFNWDDEEFLVELNRLFNELQYGLFISSTYTGILSEDILEKGYRLIPILSPLTTIGNNPKEKIDPIQKERVVNFSKKVSYCFENTSNSWTEIENKLDCLLDDEFITLY
ncbi:hypothetical protein [Bacillus alkalisoli]|uniref:hypothetical protein n=1 Tax=Bacillus alkalisoli TaxID=2011008 RepID=UPI000C236A13|nr:hypothetical protein [Bacillus alkalisoli]